MYFPYPDKSSPALKGAGSYFHAKASAPVSQTSGMGAYFHAKASAPVSQTSGLGAAPDQHASIRSPWFIQHTPWPYIKGPIYTRPVFKELSRSGNFVPYPIVRMPSLRGLGEEPPEMTPSSVCAPLQAIPDAYKRCMQFNTELSLAKEPKRTEMLAQIQEATAACSHVQSFTPWAQCYYAHLQPAWYENPWYLGGAIVGTSAALGVLALALRRSMG